MVSAKGRYRLAACRLLFQKFINCFACVPHESLLWLKQRSDVKISLAIWGCSDAYDSLVDHVVGLLEVVPYDQLTPNIVLVPLSGTAASGVVASEVERELQRIFAQAVVRPTVTLASVFSAEDYTPPLECVFRSI
jgi:hypothetical protein